MKPMIFSESIQATEGVSHYHQDPDKHPRAQVIPDRYERVELVTGGRGWVEHEEDWVEVAAGSLIWQVEGDSTIGRSDFSDPYRCLSINFRVERGRKRHVPRITRWSDLIAVRAFTDELVDLWIEKSMANEILTAYAYGRLTIQASLAHKRYEKSGLPKPLRRSEALIEQRFSKPLKIADLARAAECSAPYLHELYRRYLDGSPHQAIMERRLRQACLRLSSTNDPIKQIGLDVGFSTPAAFSHAFKRYARMTPLAYRERSRQFG
jgi:AraC-like DNA-binding protein